jgi:hypothetical protein
LGAFLEINASLKFAKTIYNTAAGNVLTWGAGNALGYFPDALYTSTPNQVPGIKTQIVQISASGAFSAALTSLHHRPSTPLPFHYFHYCTLLIFVHETVVVAL